MPSRWRRRCTTNAQGQFAIKPAPVGAFKLMADGSTAPNGPWPTLEFDIVTVAGRANDVGLPIYLPRLDTSTRCACRRPTGGTLTLPQVPGFALKIAPGSATFPGGARSGCVTVTPVNGDKVPMSPGFGQQPRFVVTIQPVGTMFNPPAQLTLPNVDGLAPRQVTEMYSYDHDLAAFVAIGTGTVSEDGSLIVSDPGVGVIKAGLALRRKSQHGGQRGNLSDLPEMPGHRVRGRPGAKREGGLGQQVPGMSRRRAGGHPAQRHGIVSLVHVRRPQRDHLCTQRCLGELKSGRRHRLGRRAQCHRRAEDQGML